MPRGPQADGGRLLARRMIRGEESAFQEFFEDYFPGLYRFALARAGQDEDAAEEIVQAALCKAVARIESYRGEAALFTWLCTLCRRELSARLGAFNPAAGSAHLAEDDPAVRAALESLVANESTDPMLATDRAQLRQAIRVALDYLPSPYGDILEWKYLREMSINEIAQRLGRSPKASESLLTRAREAFREAFTLLAGAPATGDR